MMLPIHPDPVPMDRYVGIDPGLDFLGWAQAERELGRERAPLIVACGLSEVPKDMRHLSLPHKARIHAANIGTRAYITRLFLEDMSTRGENTPGGWKGANDLIDVQTVGAMTACGIVRGDSDLISLYTPHHWKGDAPKAISHNRIVDRLSPVEAQIVAQVLARVRKSNHKEILDALGILLCGIGRRA